MVLDDFRRSSWCALNFDQNYVHLYKIRRKMTVAEAFGDVAELLAELAPSKILKIQPSTELAERVETLILKKKNGDISWEETLELERYLALDMLINLAKARARRLLAA